jgi:hypothetical protein
MKKPCPADYDYDRDTIGPSDNDKILDALERVDHAIHQMYLARCRLDKAKYLLNVRLLPRLSPYFQDALERFLGQLPQKQQRGSMVEEWFKFDNEPTAEERAARRLRLVVSNKTKAPATTPRWRPPVRPGDDDGPQAA